MDNKIKNSLQEGIIIDNIIRELKKVDRTLEDKISFYRRICLAREIYASLLPDNLQAAGKFDWGCLLESNVNSSGILTHQLADILETGIAPFAIFNLYFEELKIVAEYIAYGNLQLEENISDKLIKKAHEKAISIVSNHILNNL